nr:hypothetical protein [Tanacetum cinerariifolium]
MSPSKRKFHWGIMHSTGIKSYIDPIYGCKIWRTNRDQTIGVIWRRSIDKEGNVSRFQEYHTLDEEEEEELIMSPLKHKFRWGIMRSTGIKRYIDPISGCKILHTNRNCRIPIDLYLCKVEERMTLKKVGDQTIRVIQRRRIDKEGNVSRFQEYHTSDEEEEELSASTCVKGGIYNYGVQHNYTCAITQMDLQKIISNIVTQATNNLNNGNGNGNGEETMAAPTKDLWRVDLETLMELVVRVKYTASSFIGKALTWWNTQVQARGQDAANIHSMVGADHAGYTDRFHELAKLVPHLVTPEVKHVTRDEASKSESVGKGKKKAKEGRGFVAAFPPRRENGSFPKCARCKGLHAEKGPCIVCYNCQRPCHMARDYKTLVRHAEPIQAVRPRDGHRACYECGSLDHLRPNCPKWNQGRNQSENQLALEGNRNTRGNENRARGRAFNMNAVDALQDPTVMTSMYSLNNLYADVLFDSGADFSFLSTKFMPLLNEKPIIANLRYVIEVANAKKEEVDKIFRSYRLELGDSIFPIDLIPLGQGSFDVIVGMDWLSNHKAVIVCHEKIIRIPVEGGKVLCVQGERNVEKKKTLMCTKANELMLSNSYRT